MNFKYYLCILEYIEYENKFLEYMLKLETFDEENLISKLRKLNVNSINIKKKRNNYKKKLYMNKLI